MAYATAIYVLFVIMAKNMSCIAIEHSSTSRSVRRTSETSATGRAYSPYCGDLLRVEWLVLDFWSVGVLLRRLNANDYDMDTNTELSSVRTARAAVGAGTTGRDAAYP